MNEKKPETIKIAYFDGLDNPGIRIKWYKFNENGTIVKLHLMDDSTLIVAASNVIIHLCDADEEDFGE